MSEHHSDPTIERDRSRKLHERASETFPGGVSHNIRYFEPCPIYVDRAEGATIRDVDGNEYVDYWMNHMATLLGHAYPPVVDAVQNQADRGLHYGAVNEPALELGERVQDLVPSAERVRFCASGTEATAYATRLARAHTERPHVLKVEGGWHGGNADLTKAIHAPFDEPESAGLPPGASEHLHSFPLNDRAAVEGLLEEYAGEAAAVIIEPMLLAGGGVEAEESFLRFLADAREERGFCLIFDEVVTGVRVSPGSYQARVGITPDLTTLGKCLGGGLPVGALAGRAELFEPARPDTDVPPNRRVLAGGGTFSMNPMTAAAGLATLEVIKEEPVHRVTEQRGQRVRDGLGTAFEEAGVEATVLGTSSLFLPHFESETPLRSVRAVETRTNREALRRFHHRLFEHGHYFLPTHMGGISYATTEEHVRDLLTAAETVARELRRDGVLSTA